MVYWDDDEAKAGLMYARMNDGANGIYNQGGDWEGMYRYETLSLLRRLSIRKPVFNRPISSTWLVHFQRHFLQSAPVNLH